MDNQKEYSRYMSNFRGIDTTSEASNVALNRFSFIQNMYKDYKSGQGVAIETFPGTRTLRRDLGMETVTDAETEEKIKIFKKIYGMHSYKVSSGKVYIIVHAGKKLYYFDKDKRDELSTNSPAEFSGITMKEAKSSSFVYNNRLYLIDGENYITVYEDKGKLTAEYVNEKKAYIPTTYSDGVMYEQRNMLTDKFIEKTYFEKAVVDDSDNAFNETTAEWEYDEVKYGVICATVRHLYVIDWDYDEDGNGYPTGYSYKESDFESICYANFKKVKIDFSKVIEKEIYEADPNGNEDYSGKTSVRVVDVKEEPYNYRNIPTTTMGAGAELSDLNKRKSALKTVVLTDTVEVLEGTFKDCINLKTITLSNNIKSLEEGFCKNTSNLDTIYLPVLLETLGDGAFEGSGVKKIYASNSMYEILTADDARSKYSLPEGVSIKKYSTENMNGSPTPNIYADKNRIYIYSPCIRIEKVMLGNKELFEGSNGEELTYQPVYHIANDKRYILAIELKTSKEKAVNQNIFIHGIATPYRFTSVAEEYLAEKEKNPFNTTDLSIKGRKPDYEGGSSDAIKKSTVCCTFDDRIFFTGNPDLPNTVFYTQRDLTGHNNPTYVGVLNWFDDGMGNTTNVAMMSNASTLMVLKGNTMQDGSIYYHQGADGGNDLTPRIYPSVEGLAGLGCVGMAVNFRDDCVFMSNQGLEAIAKQTVNLERTIEHRSTNIDGLMLRSDLSLARAAEWEGYLCILIDGKLFLADSRQAFEGIGGAMEYEWYYVTDVCGYNNDNQKYFLADYMPPEIADFCEKYENGKISISDSEDGHVRYIGEDKNEENDLVKSAQFEKTVDGITLMYTVYYVEQDSKKYLVESYGERENGTPDMACEICAVEDVLFFGTEGGKLLCLNNDKRGTNDNDPDKSRIPVEWYNNSGHAYISRAVLAMENAGVPHYTKTTVKRGTILRLKAFSQSAFNVYATTDRQATTLLTSQSNSVTTFDALNFENLGLLTADSGVLAIKEKTKKWVEKQYEFRNDKPNQPFGLYSIAYRYIISGEVKNK